MSNTVPRLADQQLESNIPEATSDKAKPFSHWMASLQAALERIRRKEFEKPKNARIPFPGIRGNDGQCCGRVTVAFLGFQASDRNRKW